MRVSVVTCTFNRAEFLRKTLLSIFSQALLPEFELLVIDDGSTDHTRDIVAEFPFVRYIRLNRPGHWKNPSRALNVGIRQARAPIILFHSGGIVSETNTIAELTALVEQNPDAACFGKLLAGNATWVSSANRRIVFTLGAMRTEHFYTLRGFDEDYTDYGGEDHDMALRLTKGLHLRVIHDDTIVARHLPHPGSRQSVTTMATLRARKNEEWDRGKINHIRNLNRDWGVV
jgi:glycosyltransferase involved in cell wall biosynthesis